MEEQLKRRGSKREELIKAGIEEIDRHGISGFSIRRVAAACDVSCAAPAKHFGDKNGFLASIIELSLIHICIGPITLFDTTDYKAKLGAEVKDFNPRDYMDKSDVLRSDRYAQFGVAAACQAVEDSSVIGTLPPERVAVYFGSGIGGIRTFTEEHNKLCLLYTSRCV